MVLLELINIQLSNLILFLKLKKMKKIIFSILFSITMLVVNGQGNLQFNQVKLVSAIETVPAGKVWKIESILYTGTLGPVSNSLTQDDQIKIDGSAYTVRSARSGNGGQGYAASYFVWEQKYPIWLFAGQTLQVWVNVGQINVIEFNIIP